MQDQRALLKSIPVSIQQMADAERLGEVMAIVDKRKKPIQHALGVFFMGAVWVGAIALSAIGLAFTSFNTYLILLLVMFLFLVLFTFVGYLYAINRTNDQVVIYDHGLVAIEMGMKRVLHWDKIDQAFRGTLATPQHGRKHLSDIDTILISSQDKHVYGIDTKLPKHLRARICDAMEHGLIESRLMGMADIYEKGGELHFGMLKLSKKGFDDGREILPWSDVERIEVGPEHVVIRQKRRTSDWYNKWSPEVANACLLREMVARLLPSG